MKVFLKRAYEPPAKSDGMRVLVDRLWPRGVTKAGAGIDLWLKDVALARQRKLTLVYGARDESHNHARVLEQTLGRNR